MSMTRRTAERFADALVQECRRTMKHLKAPGYPRLYYLSYLLRDIRTMQIWGRLGNVNHISDQDSRNLFCDCRVGNYRYDQVWEGGLEDNDSETETYEYMEMPIGNDSDALKYHVWKLTDGRFREAVRNYLRKKSHHITFLDSNGGLASFRRAAPIRDMKVRSFRSVDVPRWKDFVVSGSRVAKSFPQVKNSWVEFRVRDINRLFVNSEGSRVMDQQRICELSCELWLLTKGGEGIRTRIVHVTPDLGDLPDLRSFNREIRRRIQLLDALGQAPTLKSYAGPVLLAPQPAGILIHEVLGHRLEGSRLLSTREGQTFKRDMGKQILPEFLSVVDDPTETRSGGVKAVGSYHYDDEGSPAQAVRLVDRGKLVGFLSGRAPVTRTRLKPNGHARNEYHERPISRMAHLKVEAAGGVPHSELRRLFLEQIRQQKVPFGVMILDAEGGETATEAYDFQAFMGSVALAARVFPDGRQELIRNVNFVGTPLSALRNVIAVGDTPVCQNGFCGAESGIIPVSTTCPAILLANLELQASDQRKYTQYMLPMPFEKAALRR
jgi:predicted Zn-dependent protease